MMLEYLVAYTVVSPYHLVGEECSNRGNTYLVHD